MEMLDIPIDDVTRESAMARIAGFLDDARPHFVTTPNPEMLVDAQRDSAFMAALRMSDLAIPDGVGLVLLSRFMGESLPERVTGTDMVRDIARLAAARGLRVYLLGAGKGVAHRAAAVLRAENPGIMIVGAESGGRVVTGPDGRPAVSPEVTERVKAAVPDVLFVAFGHGIQEKWLAARLSGFPDVRIAMGVGGAFDFIAGDVRRAPRVLRAIGLEWLWRVCAEPRRWRRIIKATVVFPYLALTRNH